MHTGGGEADFHARGFGLRIGFGARPAVLSIDFINGFTDESLPLGSDLDAEISVARSVLDEAREHRVPIFHTVVQYDQDDFSDAGIWRLKQRGVTSLKAGSHAVQLDRRLGRRQSEQVVVKKYASAFFGTDLVSRLVSAGVDTLLILGCTTSGCVRATAVDGVSLGFRPMVIREGVGDRSAIAHEQSLIDLDQKYADVVSAADAKQYLSALQ